jgi:hypothetical protein
VRGAAKFAVDAAFAHKSSLERRVASKTPHFLIFELFVMFGEDNYLNIGGRRLTDHLRLESEMGY